MKKILALLLSMILVLSLCACGKADGNSATGAKEATSALKVGYARENITPEYSVPLAGYGNTSSRMSTGMLDYLYTAALAFSDGENTVIIIENDLTAPAVSVLSKVRQKVSKNTGIPEERIMVAVDHVHSAPDLYNTAESSISQYTSFLIDAMVSAAEAAIEDLKPATLSAGSDTVENLSFVRHYNLEDGHVRGPSFGLQYDSPKVSHTHDPDKEMQVVRLQQEGGENILLVNFQAHPQLVAGSGTRELTADTIGAMRDHVEATMDCKVFYVLGASGDIQAVSLIESENVYNDHKSYGKAMGNAVLKIVNEKMAALDAEQIKTTMTAYTATVDKSEDSKAGDARVIYDKWLQDNDYAAAVKAGEAVGINSPYHASGILTKSNMGDTEEVKIYAFSLGDLSFVFAPYEMFCENGAYIKENSPYQHTIVCSMANESFAYISSEAGFDYNCYEANTGRFVRGTGEALAEEFVSMLNQLAGK